MNYQYSMSPYIQAAMAQAMQAIMSGGPLPSNCVIVTIPFQQAQQMFPQLMLNYASGGSGGSAISQQQSYYDQGYQPQINPYQYNQPSNALVPYSNFYSPNYNPNYNYPVVPYGGPHTKSKKKNRRSKQNPLQPHSNVYNSSSFDTDMRNLSWSRLFGTHHPRRHSKQASKDQSALSYDQKSKRRTQSAGSSTSSSSGSSSTTTSDETIRRVTVSTKPPLVPTTSSLKQQTKSSLPFKYSSEFVPGIGKQQQQQQQSQKSNKKEVKLKSDDVFVIKRSPPPPPPPPPSSSQQQ